MRCYKCKKDKEKEEFYKSSSRKRGYSGRCKECERLYRREKRLKNPEHYRQRDKKYNQKHREKRREYSRKYNKENRLKIIAHRMVKEAIKAGLLIPQPCEKCKSINKIEAHHDDYSKPLKVRWLCRTHHRRAETICR